MALSQLQVVLETVSVGNTNTHVGVVKLLFKTNLKANKQSLKQNLVKTQELWLLGRRYLRFYLPLLENKSMYVKRNKKQ
jgi:hypothetical protein